MRFGCPHCQKGLRVQDGAAGRVVACPGCKNEIRVPAPRPEVEEYFITEEAVGNTAVARAEHLPPRLAAAPSGPPPYSLAALPKRHVEDDEDEPRPERRRSRRGRSRKLLSRRVEMCLILFGCWFVALVVDLLVTKGIITLVFGITVSIAATVFMFVGRIMMLLAVLNTGSLIQCLACILIPFYGLLHYEYRRGFLVELCGWALMVGSLVIFGVGFMLFKPAPNQAPAAAAQVRGVPPAPAADQVKGAPLAAAADQVKGPAPAPALTGDPRLDVPLRDMGSADAGTARAAVDVIASTPVHPQHQALIAKKLAALVRAPDPWLRKSAIRALNTWATPEEVPALIDALDDPDTFARGDAFRALERLKDERAILPAVRALQEIRNRFQAESLLRKIGSAAELDVLALADTKDLPLYICVLGILRDIGTERCVPALQALANDSDFHRRVRAQETLKAVLARAKSVK